MYSQSWMQLAILAGILSSSFLFTELALIDLGPLTVVNLRLLFAACGLLLVWRWRWRGLSWHIDKHFWPVLLVLAVTNNILPFSLIVWAQIHISASLAAIISASVPLFVLTLAWFFAHDERPDLAKFVGVAVGFVGVVVVIAPHGYGYDENTTILGPLAVLAAVFCYSASMIYAKRLGRWQVPALVPATMQAAIGALMLLPFTLILEEPWHYQMSSIWTPVSVICLGLFCSALAFVLYFRILAAAGAVNLMLISFLIPVYCCVLGITFLNERLNSASLLGMLIVFAGLLVTDSKRINLSNILTSIRGALKGN